MIKGKLYQEDITLMNIYPPKTGTPKYIKQLLTDQKAEINSNTIIVGNLNFPLISMEISPRQKVHKEIVDLNKTLDHMDLIDTERAFHPKATEYAFFSSAHRSF